MAKARTKSEVCDGIDPKLLGGYRHGKGSHARPFSVSKEKFNKEFDRIFKKGGQNDK